MKLVVIFCVILAATTPYGSDSASESGEKGTSDPNQGPIRYIFDSNADYGIYYSQQSESFFLIDYLNSVNAYYYGKTGEIIVLTVNWTSLAYLSRNTSTMTWYSKEQSFNDFMQNKFSTKNLYLEGVKNGLEFDPLTITKKTLIALRKIVSTQVSGLSQWNSLAYVLETRRMTRSSRIPNASKVFKSIDLSISSDFQNTIKMIDGLHKFFRHFPGELQPLIEKNIQLDLTQIVTAKSGFLIIDYLFTELSKSFELGKLFGKTFNSQTHFFQFVNSLSGDSFDGFRGLIKVFSMLVNCASGEASKQTLTVYLTDYFNNDRDLNVDIQKSWQDSIENCYKKAFDLKLNNDLKQFVSVLEQIKSKKWIIGKIDMSSTVDVIIKEKQAKRGQKSVKVVLEKLGI